MNGSFQKCIQIFRIHCKNGILSIIIYGGLYRGIKRKLKYQHGIHGMNL